jgi:hypothetical protein
MIFGVTAVVTSGFMAVAGVAAVALVVDWLELEHRPEGVLAIVGACRCPPDATRRREQRVT